MAVIFICCYVIIGWVLIVFINLITQIITSYKTHSHANNEESVKILQPIQNYMGRPNIYQNLNLDSSHNDDQA